MTSSNEPIGLLDKVRAHIPGSNMTVETSIKAKLLTPGIVFKAIIKRFPECEASMEGDQLVILNPDRSIKLSFIDFEFLRNMDGGIGDRRFWDNRVTFTATPDVDGIAVKGDIAQRWSQRAAFMLCATPFTFGISAALLLNVFVRTHIFANGRLRSRIQMILKDVAKDVQRDQLTSSLA